MQVFLRLPHFASDSNPQALSHRAGNHHADRSDHRHPDRVSCTFYGDRVSSRRGVRSRQVDHCNKPEPAGSKPAQAAHRQDVAARTPRVAACTQGRHGLDKSHLEH